MPSKLTLIGTIGIKISKLNSVILVSASFIFDFAPTQLSCSRLLNVKCFGFFRAFGESGRSVVTGAQKIETLGRLRIVQAIAEGRSSTNASSLPTITLSFNLKECAMMN
jgi:hypothetical protein